MCEIIQFLLNKFIIVNYFVGDQHCIFVISIVTGECTILILRKLRFGVCHCWYCLLIYDGSVILSCFILNCHRNFLFSQISDLFICGIFEHNFFAADKAIHNLQLFITNNKYSNQLSVIKPINHLKMGFIRGRPIVVREIVTLI